MDYNHSVLKSPASKCCDFHSEKLQQEYKGWGTFPGFSTPLSPSCRLQNLKMLVTDGDWSHQEVISGLVWRGCLAWRGKSKNLLWLQSSVCSHECLLAFLFPDGIIQDPHRRIFFLHDLSNLYTQTSIYADHMVKATFQKYIIHSHCLWDFGMCKQCFW